MQDAYFVDQQKVGSWTDIGYTAPTSTNFKYEAGTAGTSDWQATALFDDDGKCATGKVWTVAVNAQSKKVKYTASDNCPALTPNFKNIGSGS